MPKKGEAKFQPYRLLQKDGDAPGGKQRIQQAAVEPPHDHPFYRQAKQRGNDESKRYCEQKTGFKPDARENGDICTDHDHFAVGHVDDAHGAVRDGETECHQKKDRAETEADEKNIEHNATVHEKGGPDFFLLLANPEAG